MMASKIEIEVDKSSADKSAAEAGSLIERRLTEALSGTRRLLSDLFAGAITPESGELTREAFEKRQAEARSKGGPRAVPAPAPSATKRLEPGEPSGLEKLLTATAGPIRAPATPEAPPVASSLTEALENVAKSVTEQLTPAAEAAGGTKEGAIADTARAAMAEAQGAQAGDIAQKQGLVATTVWGEKGQPDTADAKRKGEKLGEAIGAAVQDGALEKFDPNQALLAKFDLMLEELRRKRPREVKPRGLIETLLWGQKGPEDVVKSAKQTTQIVVANIANSLEQMVGLGGLNENMRQHGTIQGAVIQAGQMSMGFLQSSLAFGKQREAQLMQLAPLLGAQPPEGQRGRRGEHWGKSWLDRASDMAKRYKFSREEMGAAAAPLIRGGAQEGLEEVLKAQRGMGLGAELTDLLTARVQRGQRYGADEAGKRRLADMYGKIIGAAAGSRLEQGRYGELLRGVTQMVQSRSFAQDVDLTAITDAITRLGDSPGGLRGAPAVQALGMLEQLGMGGASPYGRAKALRAAGLGRTEEEGKRLGLPAFGGDIFAAQRQMELGYFGKIKGPGGAERKGTGLRGLLYTIEDIKKDFGYTGTLGAEPEGAEDKMRRGQILQVIAEQMRTSASAVEVILQSLEGLELPKPEETGAMQELEEKVKAVIKQGQQRADELPEVPGAAEKTGEKGKGAQERALEAMLDEGRFKGIETAFQNAAEQFFRKLEPEIIKIVEAATSLLQWLSVNLPPLIEDARSGFKTMGEYMEPIARALDYWMDKETNRQTKARATTEQKEQQRVLSLFKTQPKLMKSALENLEEKQRQESETSEKELARQGFRAELPQRRQEAIFSFLEEQKRFPDPGKEGVQQIMQSRAVSKEAKAYVQMQGGVTKEEIRQAQDALMQMLTALRQTALKGASAGAHSGGAARAGNPTIINIHAAPGTEVRTQQINGESLRSINNGMAPAGAH